MDESSDFEVPPALVAALKQSGSAQKKDFHVEGWTPSLLGRVVDLFVPRRQR